MENHLKQKIKKIETEAQRIEKENKEKSRIFQEHNREIKNFFKKQDKNFPQ